MEKRQERFRIDTASQDLTERQRHEVRFEIPVVEAQCADVQRLGPQSADALASQVDQDQVRTEYVHRHVQPRVQPDDKVTVLQQPRSAGLVGSNGKYPAAGGKQRRRLFRLRTAVGQQRQFRDTEAGELTCGSTGPCSRAQDHRSGTVRMPAGGVKHLAQRPAEVELTDQTRLSDRHTIRCP